MGSSPPDPPVNMQVSFSQNSISAGSPSGESGVPISAPVSFSPGVPSSVEGAPAPVSVSPGVPSSVEGTSAPVSAAPPTAGHSDWKYGDQGLPPPQGSTVCSESAFHGDFAGCSWNPGALFHQKAIRRKDKFTQLHKLINKHDFAIIQETHSLEGRTDLLELRGEHTAFWSDCTAAAAGVGIILKSDFLKRFNKIDPIKDWVQIKKGYVAVLKLRGPEGNLDIFCCYYPTGDKVKSSDRQKVSHSISANIASKDEVLTILSGDFNFVEHNTDRWNLQGGGWTGLKDGGETKFFQKNVCQPNGLVEWEQGQFTHENGQARSRLDRVYCNQHISLQMDRNITCSVLEWDKKVSHHRPISFRRMTPAAKSSEEKPIPDSEFRRKGWADEVSNYYQFLCRNEPH